MPMSATLQSLIAVGKRLRRKIQSRRMTMSFAGSRRGARRRSGAGAIVATEIIEKVRVLSEHLQLGRPIAGREEYRQIVLQVLGAAYVFQYRFDGQSLVMLRVYHARESRG